MFGKTVKVPVSLLLDPALTAAAKVLWLSLRSSGPAAPTRLAAGPGPAAPTRLAAGPGPAAPTRLAAGPGPTSPTRLAAASGLTLPTVRSGLAQLDAGGWYSPVTGAALQAPAGAVVSIPASLLPERRVRPQAKLLYGLLQTVPAFRENTGIFTYTSLSRTGRLSVVTVRALVQELAREGWLQASQANQKAPIRFTLCIPELDQRDAEAALAKRRVEESRFDGEVIMKEYLSLLIDSDEFEDNARPGWLINPLTDERLELDRYYPPTVGFEFNGPQHYRTTRRFPSQRALIMQQARDLMKEGLCARRGIQLVVITPADLNIETMQQKVGTLLPLRDLRGHEELIQYLDKVSKW